jgi:uncharacterized membrane protein (DUF106 family)
VNDWPLNDSQFVTAVILGVMLVVLIVTAFRKATVTRKEFALLREDVKRLSEEVKELQAAEQRRFIKELNASEKTTKSRSRRPDTSPPLDASSSEQTVN